MKTGKGFWRDIKGSEAVTFLMTIAMLLLIFVTLMTSLVYVFQYFNTSYLCRRVVRSIEISGKYDITETETLLNELAGTNHAVDIDVDATYFNQNKIQLRQTFSVLLTTTYPVKIWQGGNSPLVINLPIEVKVMGMSEVYWR